MSLDFTVYNEARYGSEHSRERQSVTLRERVVWDAADNVNSVIVVVRGTTDIAIRTSAGIAIAFNADDNAVADTRLSGVDLPDRDAKRYIIPVTIGVARFNFVGFNIIRADFKSLNAEAMHVWIGEQ